MSGTHQAITEQKRIEHALIVAKNEAEKANQAKSEFLSRMSHELRTPMNSILGFAQLMDMGELSPKQKKGVGHILNSGKHLLNLIDEVLDISRIESGRLLLLPEPVQLSHIIAETMDTVQPLAVARQLKLEFKDLPANQLYVMSDRKRLRQVLINLLNNAVKYNRQGGSIFVKAEKLSPKDERIVSVRISVTDTGLGIAPDDIPKLFIPFERIGAEQTFTEGTGLGLAVIKKIMDAMKGAVGVESVVGQGSTFWIELPITEQKISWENQQLNNVKLTAELVVANKEIAFQNEEKAKRAAELVVLKKMYSIESGTTVPAKTGTILYIEDNIQNAELVGEIIGDHRPEINLISSVLGEPAVKLAIDNMPDLILLDLNLPDMSGSEVLTNLLADDKTKSIPVVIITADATQHQIEKLMTAGARDYLTKPLDLIIFLQVVDEWIKK
jgi:nitrogen-specific signal transduction histidine kinase